MDKNTEVLRKYKRKHSAVPEKNISVQLGEIMKICHQLKVGQEKIRKEQTKIHKQILNIEKKINLEKTPSTETQFSKPSSTNQSEVIKELRTNFNKRLNDLENIIKNSAETQRVKLDEININVNKDELYPKIEETIDNKLKQIEENIESQNSSIKTQMTSYADILSRNNQTSSKTEQAINSISRGMETIQTNISKEKERKLREEKAYNLCVFNIPESTEINEKQQRIDDKIKVKSVIDPNLNIPKGKIEYIRRLNTKTEEKTRPIIIRFQCLETRMQILKMRNLVYKDNDKQTNIYINPDKTKQQQEENRKLVEKLRQIRNNGENAVIRNGKIITNQPFRKSSQESWDDDN